MSESKRSIVAELYLGLLNLQVEREQHDWTDSDLGNWLCPRGLSFEGVEKLQFIGQKALQAEDALSVDEFVSFMDLIWEALDAVEAEIHLKFVSGPKE